MIFDSLGSNFRLKSAIRHLFSSGSKNDTRKLLEYLNENFNGHSALYSRGRGALSAALRAAGSKKVAINGFTCSSVIDALKSANAEIVFVDINIDNYNFDAVQLEEVYKKTTFDTVIVQNTFGISQDIRPIEDFCKSNKLTLIEDLAHSLGMKYQDGRKAGTVGDYAMMSFGKDKIIDVVNGGALISRNPIENAPTKSAPVSMRFRDRIFPVLSLTIRLTFIVGGNILQKVCLRAGLIGRAGDGVIGEQYALPEYKSKSVLRGLENIEKDQVRRQELAISYGFEVDKQSNPLRLPVLVRERTKLLEELKSAGIYLFDTWYSTPVYPNRHLAGSGYNPGECPASEEAGGKIVNLPLHINISPKNAEKIRRKIEHYVEN